MSRGTSAGVAALAGVVAVFVNEAQNGSVPGTTTHGSHAPQGLVMLWFPRTMDTGLGAIVSALCAAGCSVVQDTHIRVLGSKFGLIYCDVHVCTSQSKMQSSRSMGNTNTA